MSNNQKRTRAQTKHLTKSFFQPDSGVISALKSVQQNPKFARCISFAMSCLLPLLTPPNPRHRDNSQYIIQQGGYKNLILAIIDHVENDGIIFNTTLIMTQLVGKDRFKDEEIALLIVENGGTEALISALNHPSEKSKDTINAIIDLINLLATNPVINQKLIEQGFSEALLNLLQNSKQNEQAIKKSLEALTKLSSSQQAKTALINNDIVPKMIGFLEKKKDQPAVIQCGLKFIENISRSVEGVNYLKKGGQGMQLLIKIMDNHSNDKQVLNIGSQILSKIATVEDLENTLQAIKKNPNGAHVELAMLSQLILVDELTEQLIQRGAVGDLIAIIENNIQQGKGEQQQQYKLISQCAVALGRIAEIDNKQLKGVVEQGSIQHLIAALDINDSQVVEQCINTLEKLGQNEIALQQIIEQGAIAKVLQATQQFAGNPQIAKAVISMISTLASDDNGVEQIAQNQGIENLIDLVKSNQENKDIVILGTKAISMMIIDEEKAQTCIDNGTVELVQNVAKEHPNWRKFAYYAANLLDTLSEIENVIPQMKKANGVEAVISLITGQSYDIKQYDAKEGEAGGDEQQICKQDEDEVEDVLKFKQDQELVEIGKSVLKKLINEEDLPQIQQQVSQSIENLNKEPNLKNAKALEKEISSLTYLSSIPEVGYVLLEQEVIDNILDFAQNLNKKKDFEGKSSLIQSSIDFFNNISSLNKQEKAKPLYQKKQIGQKFISFLGDILENNSNPIQVQQGLQALKAVLSQRAVQGGEKKRISILETGNGQQNVQERLIEGVIANMKKYPENEIVQLKSLDVLNTISQLSPEMNSALVKQGVTRQMISKLENDFTTQKVGKGCLRLLDNIGSSKKDALVLMNNQKAVTAIMGFLATNQNDKEIADAAQPILKKLANTNNSEFAESLVEDVKELIQQIDPKNSQNEFERKNAAESLDLLNNYALIPKCIEPILKNGAVEALVNLIQNEINQDENQLAKNGENKLNERLLNGATNLCTRLIDSQQAIKAGVLSEIQKHNISGLLQDAIKQKSNNKEVVKGAIACIANLLNNEKTKDNVVKQAEQKNLATDLVQILEQNKDDREITKATHNLLFGLTKESPQIANTLGEQDFVKNLMKETKALVKNLEDQESLEQVNNNLQYLATLAHNNATAGKISKENGVGFALAVLKKASQGLSNIQVLDEAANQLNLDQHHEQLDDEDNHEKDYHQEIIDSTLDLLGKLIEQDSNIASQQINEENILDILDNLMNVLQNKNLCQQALGLLNKACKENANLVEILKGNQGIDKVLAALNYYPTDQDILIEGGQLLETLGAQEILVQQKEQLVSVISSFDPSNEQSVAELKNVNLKLANLLAHPEEESEENLEGNKKVIQALEQAMLKSIDDVQLLASEVLLVARLCQQGDDTQKIIRDSQIPEFLLKTIIPDKNIMNSKNGKLAELIMDALDNMISGTDELLEYIDENTGKDLIFSEDYKKENIGVISDILLTGDGELVDELLEINEVRGGSSQDQPFSNDTIQNNIDFLNKLCQMDNIIAECLVEKGAVDRLKDLFDNLSNQNFTKGGSGESKAIRTVGKLLGGLAQSQTGFEQILRETDLIAKIVDTINTIPINQELINRENDQQTLMEALNTLKNICDNEFDKDQIIENQVTECVLDAIRRFNQIPDSTFKEEENLLNLLRAATGALKKFLKDPALARVVNKNDGARVLQETLQKLNNLPENQNREEEIQANENTDIFGSDKTLDRVIETTISALEELSTNNKHAEKMHVLEEIHSDLPSLVETIKDTLELQINDPYTVYNGLKTIENGLKSYDIKQIQENLQKLTPIVDICNQVEIVYPNMPLMSKLTQQINEVASGKLAPADIGKVIVIQESDQVENQEQIEQQLETVEVDQVLNKLDLITDTFEDFVKKVNKSEQISSANVEQVLSMLDTLGKFATLSSENAIKLHNMDAIGPITELVNIQKFEPQVAKFAIATIKKLTQDEKILEKLANEDNISGLIANTLNDLVKQSPVNEDNKEIALDALQTAYNMAENKNLVENLITEGIIKGTIELLNANIDNIDIVTKGMATIALLAVDSDAISEIVELGGLELMNNLADKYFNVLAFLRSYALKVGKIAIDEKMRVKFGEHNVPDKLINGIKQFPEDLILSSNTCFAMSNIVNANPKNQSTVIASEFMKQAKQMQIKMIDDKELIMNLCSFYNNVSFRNPQIKKELGKQGVMQDLKHIFDHYAKDFSKDNIGTLKQCFKAIGNIALFFENATIIIKDGFVKSASEFINQNIKISELVRFTLDIFANLASYPEEANEHNIKGMIEQESIPVILKCIKENELNTDVLQSAVNALEYMCRNKPVRNIVFENDGIQVVLKILKSQDWNIEIVLRCLKILFNLSKDNVEILLKNKVPQAMIDIINIQKNNDEILFPCLKIIQKICCDKVNCRAMYGYGFVESALGIFDQAISVESLLTLLGILCNLVIYCQEGSEVICQKGVHHLFNTIQMKIQDPKSCFASMSLFEALLNTQSNIDIIIQNQGINLANTIIQKHTTHKDILVCCFKSLSQMALANEEYRVMCQDAKCVEYIQKVIDIKDQSPIVVGEGKLTINNINFKIEEIKEEEIQQQQIEKLITPEVRNFLISGKIIKTYKSNGDRREMHLFADSGLKELFALKPKTKDIKAKWRLAIHTIKELIPEYGNNQTNTNKFNQSPFAKHSGLFKKKPDPNLCFSLLGPISSNGQKRFDIEASSLIEKKKWVECLKAVLESFKIQQKQLSKS